MAYRQVPGLRPAGSKRKKQTVSNGRKRTRPNPLEQILTQRARHVDVIVDRHPDQDHQEERPQVIPLQQVHPAPKPRPQPVQPTTQQGQALHPVQQTQLQIQAPRVQETQALYHQTVPEQQSRLRNDSGRDQVEEGERLEVNDGNGDDARDVLYSYSELQAEAEDQARRRNAEKEEATRQSKKGKAKAHSTLIRRPSLATMTNIPATSRDTRASL